MNHTLTVRIVRRSPGPVLMGDTPIYGPLYRSCLNWTPDGNFQVYWIHYHGLAAGWLASHLSHHH